MRIIHTADWHIGRFFHGMHLTDEQGFVLEQFHKIVKASKPDVVVIAGDLYDRSVPPTEAVELLDNTLSRLIINDHVKVMMIAGNHDSPQRLGFGSRVLEKQGLYTAGVPTIDDKPIILEDEYGKVAFSLLPYAEPALLRSLYPDEDIEGDDDGMAVRIKRQLAQMPANCRKVAVAHAFIAGGSVSESERILSVAGSANVLPERFREYDYTALGHLHNPQVAGCDNIRYSGSLMKYSFGEANQQKGVYIVDIDGTGQVKTEMVPLIPQHDLKVVEGYLEDILNDRKTYPVLEDYVCVRILDKQPTLDANRKLSAVYKNLLDMEKPNLVLDTPESCLSGDYRKMGELELFKSFFKAMTGEELKNEEEKVIRKEIDKLLIKNREAGK